MASSAVTPKEKRAKIEKLIRVGQHMSNLCFNSSQNPEGTPLTDRSKKIMAELYQEWDEALREVRSVQP